MEKDLHHIDGTRVPEHINNKTSFGSGFNQKPVEPKLEPCGDACYMNAKKDDDQYDGLVRFFFKEEYQANDFLFW